MAIKFSNISSSEYFSSRLDFSIKICRNTIGIQATLKRRSKKDTGKDKTLDLRNVSVYWPLTGNSRVFVPMHSFLPVSCPYCCSTLLEPFSPPSLSLRRTLPLRFVPNSVIQSSLRRPLRSRAHKRNPSWSMLEPVIYSTRTCGQDRMMETRRNQTNELHNQYWERDRTLENDVHTNKRLFI